MGGGGLKAAMCDRICHILLLRLSCKCNMWFLEADGPGPRRIALLRGRSMPPVECACGTCIGAPRRARARFLFALFTPWRAPAANPRMCRRGTISRVPLGATSY